MKKILTIVFITLFNLSTMALEIKTEITINASPEKVWKILTNFKNYPEWNPFIKSIKGNLIVNEKLKVEIEPQNSKKMTFKPKVLRVIENKEFVWRGSLLFRGIFDGKHKFEIIDNGNGTVTFKQSEIFTGLLVIFYKKNLRINTKNSFIEMNKKLKHIAEKNNVTQHSINKIAS